MDAGTIATTRPETSMPISGTLSRSLSHKISLSHCLSLTLSPQVDPLESMKVQLTVRKNGIKDVIFCAGSNTD